MAASRGLVSPRPTVARARPAGCCGCQRHIDARRGAAAGPRRRRAASTAASGTGRRACRGRRSHAGGAAAEEVTPKPGTVWYVDDGRPAPSCRGSGTVAAARPPGETSRSPRAGDMAFADQPRASTGSPPSSASGTRTLRRVPDPHAVERGRAVRRLHRIWLRGYCGRPRRPAAHPPRDRPGRIDQVPPVGTPRPRVARPAPEPQGGQHRRPR